MSKRFARRKPITEGKYVFLLPATQPQRSFHWLIQVSLLKPHSTACDTLEITFCELVFLKKNISINIISIFHFQDNYNLWFCLDEEEILSTIYFVSHEWKAKWMGVIYIFNSFVSVDCSLSSATLPVDVNWSKFPETSPQFSGFSSVLFILSRCLTELYSKVNVSESKHFST